MAIALLAILLLAGCAAPPRDAPPAARAGHGAAADLPPAPDVRCETDDHCAVKNVGNCCGYYPACVNRDAETNPERVREHCAAKGLASVCGFVEIEHCVCVESRCQPAADGRVPFAPEHR